MADLERSETWNLSEGLGRIRWGDEFATVLRLWPEARQTRRRMGRNPRTGEVIEVLPGLIIPRFLNGPDALSTMEASVEFNELDGKRVVEQLALSPEFSETEYDFESRKTASERMILFLAEKLGLQPLELDLTWDLMEQRWERGGASVVLFRENADDFALFIEPPASSG